MFSFCPHCGDSIGQEQIDGRTLVCRHCGKEIGVVAPPRKVVVDQAEELIRQGTAARCPLCRQLVEVKTRDTTKSFVPHFDGASPPKRCPNSGKPLAAAPARSLSGPKDLKALMTREVIRVVSCLRGGDPQIEELSLAYLDKSDRVRTQIEALRELLGPDFRMSAYPAPLNQPHLAVWASATTCVVARKHEQGGFQPMAGTEIMRIVDDFKQNRQMFWP